MRRFRPALSPSIVRAYWLCLVAVMIWQHERLREVVVLGAGGWTALLPCAVFLQASLSAKAAVTGRKSPRTTEYYLVSALAVVGLGSLLQYYPVPDSMHIYWSLGPVYGLFAYLFWRSTGWPALVVSGVLAAAFCPALFVKVRSVQQAWARPLVTLSRPAVLRGMQVPLPQARNMEQITNLVEKVMHHQRDISSALIGNNALYLCFTDNKTNVSPYFVTWPGLADQAANQTRWANIQSQRPMLFLHKARWGEVANFYKRSHYLPLLYLPDEALEVAVPQELADAMGLGAYGAAKQP
jgi:hypothetical protein